MFDVLDRFEKYMDHPNKIYLMMGVIYVILGVFIYFNPVCDIVTNGVLKDAILKINSYTFINLVFNPLFYLVVGVGHIFICSIYYFVNKGWVE
jgi:hypothetical protein